MEDAVDSKEVTGNFMCHDLFHCKSLVDFWLATLRILSPFKCLKLKKN